jgi:hypothetical protein
LIPEIVTTEDVEGFFSVLVFRGGVPSGTQTTVSISATPMKNENGSSSYLPYKITDTKTSSNVVNTLGNPSSSTAGVSNIATTPSGTSGIRDIRVFKYLIPKATNVEYGKYSATVFFSTVRHRNTFLSEGLVPVGWIAVPFFGVHT